MPGSWERVEPPVPWKSRPILWMGLAGKSVIVERFGEPMHGGVENHFGDFDGWIVRFACGLEASLVWYHGHFDLPAGLEVLASADEPQHLLFHLGLPYERWGLSDPDHPEEVLAWSVVRQDDNGQRAIAVRTTSRCEAEARAKAFEAAGHKQLYWVEPA
jgi:hypothetical protein